MISFERLRLHCVNCLLLLSLLLLSGCGGPSACTVEGNVTFKSESVKKGAIRFFTEDGTPGNGGLAPITDGKYSVNVKGMYAGKYVVAISGFEETGRKFVPEPGAAEITEERQFIPAKYNSKSKLIVELKKGANTEDFALTQ